MKKKYQLPELEVIRLSAKESITSGWDEEVLGTAGIFGTSQSVDDNW